MTPRVIPANELRPDFASPVDSGVRALVNEGLTPPKTPEVPALAQIPFGDLLISPGLGEYQEKAQLGALPLEDLGQRLQNAGHIQRAALAYERVLDSTPAGTPIQEKVTQTLANLKVVLPPWNADPSTAIPLQIHINTARTPETLTGAITTLTELISVGSGQLCQPSFHIQSAPQPKHELPSLPLAIWMTLPEEDPEKPSLEVVTLAPDSDDNLDAELTTAVYRLLARRISAIGNLTPLPDLTESNDSEQAVVNRITRLAWQQILTTPFQSLQAGPPILVPEEEPENASENTTEEESESEPTEPSSPSE